MRTERSLTASNPTLSINVTFDVVALVVFNPTASPVFIRTGAPDLPDQTNANIIVPAAQAETIPVGGPGARDFGLVLGSPTLVSGTGSSVSGLFQTVVVTFLSANEIVPTFGSYSFLNLSLSNLTAGFLPIAGATTSAWFDLSPWGGALLYLLPTAASGQGILTVQTTNSLAGVVTANTVASYAFWPNSPVILNVPRTARYVRFVFGDTGIAGQPALAASYFVRASLEEILNVSYTQIGASITANYNLPALSSGSAIFCTIGLKSISYGLKQTIGQNIQVIFAVGSLPTGPWRRIEQREQNATPGGLGDSLFRSVGSLDQYLQVTLVETSNVNMQGTTVLQVTPDPEDTSILSEILSALGTTYDPVNVGQNIYQVLKTSSTTLGTINTHESNIDAYVQAYLPSLSGISTNTSNTNTSVLAGNTLLGTVNTNLGTLHTDLGTVISNLSGANSVWSRLDTVNTHLGTIESYDLVLSTATNRSSRAVTMSAALAPGAWAQFGAVFNNGEFIQNLIVSVKFTGAPGDLLYVFGVGGGGATPSLAIFQGQYQGAVAAASFSSDRMDFYGTRSGGFQVGAAQTFGYLFSNGNGTGYATAIVSS